MRWNVHVHVQQCMYAQSLSRCLLTNACTHVYTCMQMLTAFFEARRAATVARMQHDSRYHWPWYSCHCSGTAACYHRMQRGGAAPPPHISSTRCAAVDTQHQVARRQQRHGCSLLRPSAAPCDPPTSRLAHPSLCCSSLRASSPPIPRPTSTTTNNHHEPSYTFVSSRQQHT